MSQLIKDTLKWIGKGSTFLLKGYVLNQKKGAKLVDSEHYRDFLSASNRGLLLDGKSLRLTETESFQNLLAIAPIGQGKTTTLVIPPIFDLAKRHCSMVINDPKGEVCELTSGYLQRHGFDVVIFNPDDPACSNYFNPLPEARSDLELEQFAEALIFAANPGDKDAFWNNGAVRIVSVLLKCLRRGDPQYFNLPNLYHLVTQFGCNGKSLNSFVAENAFDEDYPNDYRLIHEWKGITEGHEEVLQSFATIAQTALKALSNREISAFLSHNDYPLEKLRQRKTAIFFITPPDKQDYYAFMTSLFFTCIFKQCMRRENLTNHSLPVYVLLDEGGNCYIPDFVSVANTIRGYRVSITMILQSISQLEVRYGRSKAESITGAFLTKVGFPGSDQPTTEYFSRLAGRVRTEQKREFTDTVTSYQEYNLLNSAEIRTLNSGEILVVSRNRQPILLKHLPYYQNRAFLRASQIPPVTLKPMPIELPPLIDL